MASDQERRAHVEPVEYRNADGTHVIGGYAAVFNEETVIAGLFRERIAPGAFADAIQSDDTVALFNHDPNYPLARMSNQTLRLKEDRRGLRYEADLDPEDPDAQKVRSKIKRGTVKGSSFGFTVDEDDWDDTEVKRGKLPLRTIRKIGELFDVSPVTFPAYTATSVSARSKTRAEAIAHEAAAAREAAGIRARDEARTAIEDAKAWGAQ